MPIANRSPDTADAYLAEGMTDEVGNHLSGVRRLQVKARSVVESQWTRSDDPLRTARALRVAWYVHGSIRHEPPRLLVSVELVRSATGEQTWAWRFNLPDDDIFAAQAEIAESIAVVIMGRLAPRERAALARRPTRNNDAYRLYVFANALADRRTARDVRRAVDAYTRVLELDPRFAEAWAGLAVARLIQQTWGFPEPLSGDSLLALAQAFARRALALDSASGGVWTVFGAAQMWSGDYSEAHASLQRALALDSLNPGGWDVSAMLYGPWGLDLDTLAAPLYRRAIALNPEFWKSWSQLGTTLSEAGRLAEAEAVLDTAVALAPSQALRSRSWVRFVRGNPRGALADLDQLDSTDYPVRVNRAIYRTGLGDSVAARDWLARLNAAADSGKPDYYSIAEVSVALGMADASLAALEAYRSVRDPREPTCAPGMACSTSIRVWRTLHDPIFAPLHGLPRYRRLLEQTRPIVPWLPGWSR